MKKVLEGLFAIALLCVVAHAATVNTTLTINGTGTSTSSTIGATGTASFSGGLTGSGTFISSFSLTDPNVLQGKIPVSLTVTTGTTTGTLTGTLTASATLLLQILTTTSTASGTGTIAITAGTAGFAGATGSFNVNVAGVGAGSTGSGLGSFTITGPGTLTAAGLTGGGPAPPTVSAVWDAASNTPILAQGSIFIIKGSSLCPSGTKFFDIPRPTVSPDGVKITFTPTGGGGGTDAILWYEYNPSGVCQLAGILPSTVLPGNYNVTVSNGTVSAPMVAQVVKSKFAFFTQDSSGAGLAVAQDVVTATRYDLNRLTSGTISGVTVSPAHPGQPMVAYGTGLGPLVGGDNAATPIYDFHANGVTIRAVVGGVSIPVDFAGRAGYAGEDQINFTLPANVPTGCTITFQLSVDGALSPPTFIAIAPATGATECVQPGFTSTQLRNFDNGATYTVGSFSLSQLQETVTGFGTVKLNSASGGFVKFSGFQLDGLAQSTASTLNVGSCSVTHTTSGGTTVATSSGTGLDAGAVTLNGPSGSSISNLAFKQDATTNAYSLALATDGLPVGGGTGSIVAGTYTIAGAGGKDVNKFNSSLTVGTPIALTGGLPANVVRSAGLPLSWTGGNANDIVEIIGSSGTTTGTGSNAVTDSWTFICTTTAGAKNFTVPASVLLQLPAVSSNSTGTNTGFLEFVSSVAPANFTATLTAGGSIDNGFFLSLLGIGALVSYQ